MRIDSKRLPAWGPFGVTAYLVPDYDTKPTDFDCYTPRQVDAWKNDEWSFVGLMVEVDFNGMVLGVDSLFGIEFGYLPITDEDDNLVEDVTYTYPLDHLEEWWSDVVDEAKANASEALDELKGLEVPA